MTSFKLEGRWLDKKLCFIVTGPESSGTTMIRRALVLSGVYEDLTIWDGSDRPDLSGLPGAIVIHRSIPHGQMWPDLRGLYDHVLKSGYQPMPAVMFREFNATAKSQVKRGLMETEGAAHRMIRMAIQTAVRDLPGFTPVSYERFCNSAAFRRWLFVDHWGIPESPIDIWPANDAHYGGLQ